MIVDGSIIVPCVHIILSKKSNVPFWMFVEKDTPKESQKYDHCSHAQTHYHYSYFPLAVTVPRGGKYYDLCGGFILRCQ